MVAGGVVLRSADLIHGVQKPNGVSDVLLATGLVATFHCQKGLAFAIPLDGLAACSREMFAARIWNDLHLQAM